MNQECSFYRWGGTEEIRFKNRLTDIFWNFLLVIQYILSVEAYFEVPEY